MKKGLVALATLIITACHTEKSYIFDVPKILAMDGRKIPDILGTPQRATSQQLGTYLYAKDEYAITIYYDVSTGKVTEVAMAKIIPEEQTANTDIEKEKADLPAKFNLKSITQNNFQLDTISVLRQPASPILIRTSLHFVQPAESIDSTTIPVQPTDKK